MCYFVNFVKHQVHVVLSLCAKVILGSMKKGSNYCEKVGVNFEEA